MTQFQLHKRYSFQVHAPMILGQDFHAVTLVGILDFEAAQREADVHALHNAVRPYLPEGTPSNYRYLTYLRFRDASGAIVLLAREWIQSEGIEQRDEYTATITLPNVTPQDAERIRQALSQNGFSGLSIELS